MKFTVTFNSHESADMSYGLVFIPSPVWVQGCREIIPLDTADPHYQQGGLRKLLNRELFLRSLPEKTCSVTIHPHGHGCEADLQTLLHDLGQEGYTVTLHRS